MGKDEPHIEHESLHSVESGKAGEARVPGNSEVEGEEGEEGGVGDGAVEREERKERGEEGGERGGL